MASLSSKGSSASVLLVLMSAVLNARAADFCGAFQNGCVSDTSVKCVCEYMGGPDGFITCGTQTEFIPAPGCNAEDEYVKSTAACDAGCVNGGTSYTDDDGFKYCGYPTGGVCGDPHFYGFDSSDWDFQGEVNATYSLISGVDTQVNARFVLRDKRYDPVQGTWYQLNQFKETSTWIGGISVRFKRDVVVVEKLENMSMVVQANGHKVPFDTPVQLPDGLFVHFKNVSYVAGERRTNILNGFKNDEGYTTFAVLIDSRDIKVQVEIPPTFSRRMDLSAALNAPKAMLAGQFDGMLGRTIRNVTAENPVITMEEEYPDTTWVIDIDEQREKLRYSATLEEKMISAYETSGLLEYDSAINRYTPETLSDKPSELPFVELPSTLRRSLMDELNIFLAPKFAGAVF